MPENAETIHLKVDLNKWLSNVALKENNSLMIPGKKAIEMANENSVVLALGKGDESSQIIYDKKFPFSDKEEILKILKNKE